MGSRAPQRRQRQLTLALVVVAALLERADEALLPAVYREVGAALGASPAALGSLTLCRALAQAACYPLATLAAARHDRARVVAAGAFLWAVATLLVGASSTFLQMAIARGFNGVGLALVVPAIYSLVADCSDDATRGSAFGWLYLALQTGAVLGGSLATMLAPATFLGVPGWRLAFHAVALVSLALAASMWLLAADPRPAGASKGGTATAAGLLREVRGVVSVRTFQIVVAQGVVGSVPWSALGFAAMWLELLGLTHWETTVVTGVLHLAVALGAFFSGFAADALARRFPDTGRVALAQASTALTVPLAAVMLLALPGDDHLAVPASAYAAAFFVFGFVACWCPAGTNNPIFAEVVPATARTTVYALDKCFESVFASFAPPVVGVLAERAFGYQPAVAPGASAEADRANAAALGKAVFAEVAVPITVCCLVYSLLYWTYPADRRRAQMPALPLHAAAAAAAEDDQCSDCKASRAGTAATAAGDEINQALLLGSEY